MPNATMRANAQAMPMNRRAALGAIAAGAMLAASGVAAASDLDQDVAAAVERVTAAVRVEQEAHTRLSALERGHMPPPPAAALTAQELDFRMFGALARVGDVLTTADMDNARSILARLMRQTESPDFTPSAGQVLARVTEIERAEREWRGAREAARVRAGLNEAEAAYDDAASELGDAQDALLEAQPRTIAGVRAMLARLLDTDALSDWPVADTLARALLDAPALGGEA